MRKNPKPVLNKRQIVFFIGRQLWMLQGREISFGIINIQSLPKEGDMIKKDMYKGFRKHLELSFRFRYR